MLNVVCVLNRQINYDNPERRISLRTYNTGGDPFYGISIEIEHNVFSFTCFSLIPAEIMFNFNNGQLRAWFLQRKKELITS